MLLLQLSHLVCLIEPTALMQWLLATGLGGSLAMYLGWLKLFPKLSIESVIDKSKKFPSESKIKIKNIGKLHAWNIHHDARKLNVTSGGIKVTDGTVVITGKQSGHLSADESMEISVKGAFVGGNSVPFTKCEYILVLKYEVRFLRFHKELSRQWKVKLNTFEDGYSWDTNPFTPSSS